MFILPALLAAAQLLLWPILPLVRDAGDVAAGTGVAPGAAVVVVLATLAAAAGLTQRRRRPVHALVVVAAAITAATLAVPAGQYVLVPGDAILVLALTDLVALYSVAVHRPARTVLVPLGGVVLWQTALTTVTDGFAVTDVVLLTAVYVVAAALGRARARWNAERAAAARRLEAARKAHAEAADAERRRLARELHDVTAHHLTSVVVNAQAAQLLGDSRPELRAEALAFAARTGRDTLAALRRLVAIMPLDEPRAEEVPSLAALAEDFGTLGQRVTLSLPDGEPAPAIAEAIHGIAREALTNTLRYAPGGAVTLLFRYGVSGAELVVEDHGGDPGTAAATGLGGGRGVTGMRERAGALGGTVEAGPRTQGGWVVRALVPQTAPGGAGRRLRRWAGSRAVLDFCLILLVLALPLAGLGSAELTTAAWWAVTAAMIVHAAPLWWRRRHPWPVLAVVAATGWIGPLLCLTRVAPADAGWLFLFGTLSELVAVHAAGSFAGPPRRTWPAPLVTLSPALALAATMGFEPGTAGSVPMAVLLTGVFTVLFGVVLIPAAYASWWAGVTARARRDGRREREEGRVAAVLAGAEARAAAERARIADGLRAEVLRHAADLPEAAERGDLTGVLGAARHALTAMRSLLDGLTGPSRRDDQPAAGHAAHRPAAGHAAHRPAAGHAAHRPAAGHAAHQPAAGHAGRQPDDVEVPSFRSVS